MCVCVRAYVDFRAHSESVQHFHDRNVEVEAAVTGNCHVTKASAKTRRQPQVPINSSALLTLTESPWHMLEKGPNRRQKNTTSSMLPSPHVVLSLSRPPERFELGQLAERPPAGPRAAWPGAKEPLGDSRGLHLAPGSCDLVVPRPFGEINLAALVALRLKPDQTVQPVVSLPISGDLSLEGRGCYETP